MRSILTILFLATVTLLNACGQQGPLYFPEQETESTKDVSSEESN